MSAQTHSYRHLRSDVAKLRPHREEQIILLPEWAGVVLADSVFLHRHVGIRDLGHGREEEKDDEEGNEARDTQVHPLHVLEALVVIYGVGEENAGC